MSSEYWDQRARNEYEYKGEKFYTITAIPYYYKRREWVLRKIMSIATTILDKNERMNLSVCDLGCGDGEYVRLLSTKLTNASYCGIDISEEMIDEAKRRIGCSDISVTYYVSDSGILGDGCYDLIYMIAVCAHLDDNTMQSLFANVYEHLNTGGKFMIFEQTAPYHYGGKSFVRRTCEEYNFLLESNGFQVSEISVVDYWLHRLILERNIVKWWLRRERLKYNSDDDIRIDLNRKAWYRGLSAALTMLSFPYVFNAKNGGIIKNSWGYCCIVSSKKSIKNSI